MPRPTDLPPASLKLIKNLNGQIKLAADNIEFQQLSNQADIGHAGAIGKMNQIAGALQSLVFYLEATEVGEAHEERVNYELEKFHDLVRDYLV